MGRLGSKPLDGIGYPVVSDQRIWERLINVNWTSKKKTKLPMGIIIHMFHSNGHGRFGIPHFLSYVLIISYNSGLYNSPNLKKISGQIPYNDCNDMPAWNQQRQDLSAARLRLLQPRDQVDGQVVAAIHLSPESTWRDQRHNLQTMVPWSRINFIYSVWPWLDVSSPTRRCPSF